MRAALTISALLTVVMMFLWASLSSNTAQFSEHYWPLLLINLGLMCVVLGLVIYQLYKLVSRLRHHQFGSRLTLNLVLLFVALGVIPVMLVYVISIQFITRSIDSWFNVRVEKAMESSVDLGQNALDHLKIGQERQARRIVNQLADVPYFDQQRQLELIRDQLNADSISLLNMQGQVLTTANKSFEQGTVQQLTPHDVFQVRRSQGVSTIDVDTDGQSQIRVLMPISSHLNPEAAVLEMVTKVPEMLATPMRNVEEVYRDYEEISATREALKTVYLLTLTMVLLSTLFLAIAFAFMFGNRLAAPLSVLAEGTRAVAEGDFSPREAVGGADELALLTRSFNQMTRQLDEAREVTDQHRQQIEAARAYLESILLNLSAGVLAFDDAFKIRTLNQGAQHILQDSLESLKEVPLPDWTRHVQFAQTIFEQFNTDDEAQWQKQVFIDDETPMTLLIRGSRLPAVPGMGYVVVFDDITQLVAAQKLSAWGEVARRLAHEIKNPLTPIQLSAERVLFKLGSKLAPEDAAFLERSTNIIVEQVDAMKNMVNNFRQYAKLPAPKLTSVDLNAFILNILQLYDPADIPIQLSLDENLKPVWADLDQLRQVVHNLIQNAQDAQTDSTEEKFIKITTEGADRAFLIVEDNGPGFPEAIIKRAFEPYVTTKPKGTGLGLAIVKHIVDEHRGTISLTTSGLRGAKVIIGLRFG